MQSESVKLMPLGDHWSHSEVDETALKDARLGRRFGDLLCRLSDRMGGKRWLGLFEQVRAIYKWSGCRLIMPLREAVG